MKLDWVSAFKAAGISDLESTIVWSKNIWHQKISEKEIIVCDTEHFANPDIFLPLNQRPVQPIESIFKIVSKHPDQKFVFVNSCLNMPTSTPNTRWVSWAPHWLANDLHDYRKTIPIIEKNFSEKKIWISLNRNRRIHRYLTSMLLLGYDLDKTGHLSIDPTEIIRDNESWQSWLSWWQLNDHPEIFDVEKYFDFFQKGFNKLKQGTGYQYTCYAPLNVIQSTAQNFETFLQPLYKNTLVEIINETIWQPDIGGIISEKYLNSIYGKNFPILIGTVNSIQSIRETGFDVFDDIIDHSYDGIMSPTLRLVLAIERNQKILKDFNYAKACWLSCQTRMDYNVSLAKKLEHTSQERLINVLINRYG